jgi:hypothetical protein
LAASFFPVFVRQGPGHSRPLAKEGIKAIALTPEDTKFGSVSVSDAESAPHC